MVVSVVVAVEEIAVAGEDSEEVAEDSEEAVAVEGSVEEAAGEGDLVVAGAEVAGNIALVKDSLMCSVYIVYPRCRICCCCCCKIRAGVLNIKLLTSVKRSIPGSSLAEKISGC